MFKTAQTCGNGDEDEGTEHHTRPPYNHAPGQVQTGRGRPGGLLFLLLLGISQNSQADFGPLRMGTARDKLHGSLL